MELLNKLIQEIQQELQLRLCDESFSRIEKCLHYLDDEQIWYAPSEHINSIGNLVLHLEGNINQWLLDGFFGISYVRMRDEEFSARKSHTKIELLSIISLLKIDIESLIYKINIDLLLAEKTIQSYFQVSGFSIISHVIEHSSYHTGQIAQLTKWMRNGQVGFYDDLEL